MPLIYRKIQESDRQLLTDWIAADPDHAGKNTADFWIIPSTSFAIEDSAGPIMFVRQETQADGDLRVHVQFDSKARLRTAKALSEALPRVKDSARNAGCKGMIFESVSPSLINFCCKLHDFKSVGHNDYRATL